MKRAGILSKKTVLRELVLRNGGRMFKNAIRNSHKFRGWDWPSIYSLVYALREEFFGVDGLYGVEVWEVLGDEVIALESKLTIHERNKISDRIHNRQRGSGRRTVDKNLLYRARIKKELSDGATKVKSLEESCEALGLVIKSSDQVVAATLNEEQGSGDKRRN
ncbi:hypothetical protein ES708_17808 [subsurface metagenome]